MTSNSYDAIILGAGAAGLMTAAVAGQRGRRVLLIDHADQIGKKILISGGGRCNFTNVNTAADRYISANKHFAKSDHQNSPPACGRSRGRERVRDRPGAYAALPSPSPSRKRKGNLG